MNIVQNRNASFVKSCESKLCLTLALIAMCVVAGEVRTAHAAVLYSIDRSALPWPNLVTLDTVGGTVNVIGSLGQSVTQTDLAIANGRLYAVDTNSTVDVHLLEISTLTGAVVTSCPVTFMGMPVLDAEGLAQAGGKLYIAFRDPTGGALPSISHAVGELRLCGVSGFAVINPTTVIDYIPSFAGVDIDGMTEFPCGLTEFPDSDLFGVDHDPTAQQHTYMALSGTIAINGVFPDVPPERALNDLVFCGGNLFGIDDGTNPGEVTFHDTTTGAILSTVMTYPAQYSLTGLAGRDCCVEAPNNMVAWWPFDEPTGPTAYDIALNNHGTHMNGPTPIPGVVQGALSFSGSGDYVQVPHDPSLNFGTGGFSIDAWVRLDPDDAMGTRTIVDKREQMLAPSVVGFHFFTIDGFLGFQMADGFGTNCQCGSAGSVCTNYVSTSSLGNVATGNWVHVAVTVSRTPATGTLYVDAQPVLVFTPRLPVFSVDNGAQLWIGQHQPNSCLPFNLFWKGDIDEVEIFSRALTVDEIELIHDACRAGKCKWCSAIDEFCADPHLQDDCMGSGLPDTTCLPTSVIIQMGLPPVVEACDCCEPGCCRGIQIAEIPPGEYELSCNPVDCPPPQVGICQIFVDGVPQGVSNILASTLADGSKVKCDCLEQLCPLPVPEPDPSCAARQETDCPTDDPGLTCLPTVIQLVDDGAGGFIPDAVKCDCTECYAVYTGGMVPPVDCVGTCPTGLPCTLIALDMNADGVDDWFECHCFVDCCLPDGTCITTTADDCQDQTGTQVPDCLGDEACCLPDGTCTIIDKACCEDVLGGQALGTGSVCLGDVDLDGVDDACDCAANDTATYILRSGNPAITVWAGPGGVPLSGSAFVFADFNLACSSPPANVVTTPNGNWLPGSSGALPADPLLAQWIAANPTAAPHSGLYCYEFDICCPDIVMSEITFSFAVDDRLGDLTGGPNIEGVYINTTALPGFNGGGFTTETTIFGSPIPLVTGTNRLHVYARDTQFSVSGLIFSAGINVQCASEACCFSDGTCLDLDPCCCTDQGGVPQGPGSVCLGDSDLNGIDDACECGVVDGPAGPFCDGICPGPLPPVEECLPRCVNFNPGPPPQTTVTDCDCRDPNACRVLDIGIGEPDCVNNCNAGGICMKNRIVLGDGTIDICCDCTPAPPAPPVFTFEALPAPAGTTASEVSAIAIREESTGPSGKKKKKNATGRVRDASGVWHAGVWSQEADAPWTFELLPAAGPSVDSRGNGIAYRETDYNFICRIAGSVGTGATEAPAGWVCTGDPCTWTAQTVALPAGATGGRMNWVGTRMVGGTPESLSGGSVTIPEPGLGLIRKACVWEWDGNAWQPTLLPGLATDPVAKTESLGHMEDIACGVAGDDSGNDKPVVWTFDAGLQTWNPPIELPLLSGGTQGLADNGLVFDDAGTAVTIVIGTSETGGGGTTATHGVLWRQVAGGPWEAPIDLPPLAGMANSRKAGIITRKPPTGADPGGGTTIIVVGASYDGPDTDVATRWEVDPSVSPAVVTIHDLNDLTPDLPANLTLGEATAAGNDQTGREDTILCQAFELGGPRRAGPTDPHAVILTALPKQGTPKTADYPHDRRKNRYISFDPNKADNDGSNVAFKVELLTVNQGSCDDGTGAQGGNVDFCRIDRGVADCKACSASADSCISASIDCPPGESCDPTGATCLNDAPNSGGSNVGMILWVGPEKDTVTDPNLNIHLLVSEPFRKVSDNWPNPVHAGDCEVVPQAAYGVRAVETAGGAESDELVVKTTQFPPVSPPAPFWWGDVVGVLAFHCNGDIREQTCDPNTSNGDCTGPSAPAACCTGVGSGLCDCPGGDPCERAWELPNGVTNVDDVTAALWTSAPAPPTTVSADFTWVDVHGNDSFTDGSQNFDPPNNKINASDLQQIGSAFGGLPYKFYDPADCPNESDWPS